MSVDVVMGRLGVNASNLLDVIHPNSLVRFQ